MFMLVISLIWKFIFYCFILLTYILLIQVYNWKFFCLLFLLFLTFYVCYNRQWSFFCHAKDFTTWGIHKKQLRSMINVKNFIIWLKKIITLIFILVENAKKGVKLVHDSWFINFVQHFCDLRTSVSMFWF